MWEENQKEWLPENQMKKMFQERECDEPDPMKMENWPSDLALRRLFWRHKQGQFPWRGQNQSLKMVGLRETRRRIGNSKFSFKEGQRKGARA